ncbi:hypothetical protein WN55_08713 [Dufourea novaeangliae]|uniref:Uncharacterized protein n=1 Tax=Dufourea novaeangliae TaxID=178035 RepID=A0A154NZK6_DUFNO|nr:hypothetical protein WN55_08713 [Dufourea novaeangliae]
MSSKEFRVGPRAKFTNKHQLNPLTATIVGIRVSDRDAVGIKKNVRAPLSSR